MKIFQHQLWGYQIELPDNWNHQPFDQKDGFSEDADAFQSNYQGEKLAQLIINGEWNPLEQSVFDLWQRHLAKTSLMLGAKNLGSAPWKMAGASGYEIEIVLPKKNPRRLWTGVLENGFLVLTFLVLHWKENLAEIEPLISRIIASLKYLKGVDKLELLPNGLPLPSGLTPANPLSIVPDITKPEIWQAFLGDINLGALQAFYLRELPLSGWKIKRYVPYPNKGTLPFARIIIEKEDLEYTVGLMPGTENGSPSSIIIKTE